jgi:hypothetical protein
MDAAGIGVKQAFTNGDYSLGTFQTRDELPIALGVYMTTSALSVDSE